MFIKRAKKIHGNKYDYSKLKYINNRIKLKVICPEHGIFEQLPANHLRQNCPLCVSKKMTTKKFIKKAKKIHGDKYDYNLVEYINKKIKVKIICPEHGVFKQIITSHISNRSGCPKCANIKLTNIKRKNVDEFIKKAKIEHDNKYDYRLVNYISNKTKIKIICTKHGIFEQTPTNHYRSGCLLCVNDNKKLTTEKFIKKAKIEHGNKYDYSLVNYKNNKSKVKIICEKHGIFEQIPGIHLKGHGCLLCANDNKKLTTEIFIKKAKEVHGDKYNYSLVDYKNNKSKVKIICAEHGVFQQIPESHLQGHGCLECSNNINRLSTEIFIEKAEEVHGDKYDYSLVDYKNNKSKVQIICKKHGIFEQSPSNHIKSQGCVKCNSSKGEELISKYLSKSGVFFIEQFNYIDCKDKRQLPFDFHLPNYNICIEFDGIQHFKAFDFFGGKDKFEITKKHDQIKNIYCKENNINLIRIKYNENIEEKLKLIL